MIGTFSVLIPSAVLTCSNYIDRCLHEPGVLDPKDMRQQIDLDVMTVDRCLDDGRPRRDVIYRRDSQPAANFC